MVRLAIVLLGLAWATPAWAQLMNPGPLHKTHSAMSGDSSCSKCHSSGKRVSANLCLTCHDDLRISSKRGLHGRQYAGKACESCHVEHIGKNSRLIRWPGGSQAAFKHNLTGWTLKGSHAKVACAGCHKKKNRRRNKTFIGQSQECASCHDDVHKSRFGTNCQKCHDEQSWRTNAIENFDHNLAKFPLKGKHAAVDCKECHGKPARWKGILFGDCAECHRDPHAGRFRGKGCASCHSESGWNEVDSFRKQHPGVSLRNGHRRVACAKCHDQGNTRKPKKGKACVKCHSPVHKAKFGRNCKGCHRSIKWVGLPESVGRENHSKTRYPLLGQHRKTECASCHDRRAARAKRYRNLDFKQCNQCHSDPHKAEFDKRGNGDCAQCHTLKGFWPTRFGIAEHSETSFPLEGKHTATPCSACHSGKRPRTSFAVPKKACADCHSNPHGTQFALEIKKSGCATCHNTGGWRQPKIDHSSWPLTGAHASAVCEACHVASEADRKQGTGATYRGLPRECSGCHEDQHAGQFRISKPIRPCRFCHKTDEFKIDRFAHDKKTTYPLTGGHIKLKCESCHKPEGASANAPIRYRLGYRDCKDCHASPHTAR